MPTPREERCTHRWLLSEPNARYVRGVCRRCGARRTYPSGLELLTVVPERDDLAEGEPVLVVSTRGEHVLV